MTGKGRNLLCAMKVGAQEFEAPTVFAGAESIKSTPLVLRQFILPGKKGDRWWMTCMESVRKKTVCRFWENRWSMGAASGFSGGYAEISGSCRSCKKYKMPGDHKS